MKILITGSEGYIGQHLVKKLKIVDTLDNIHLAYPLCAFTEFNDSDLEKTRPLANTNNQKIFSKSFNDRINHADFGT